METTEIKEKIKEVYGTQKVFCELLLIDPRDINKKINTAINQKKWLDDFYSKLNMRVCITESECSET